MHHRRAIVRRLGAGTAIALGLGPAAWSAGGQAGPVHVYGVGVPSTVTSRWGTRNTVVFNVRVRNDSSGAAPCLIRVELEGVATSSASPVTAVPAAGVALVPVSVDVDLTGIPSGGDRLPFSVVLLDARRQVRNRFSGSLPVQRVAPALAPDLTRPRVGGFTRDYSVERIEHARSSRLAVGGGPGSEFVVVVKNRGRERWSYVGELGGEIALGTPESHLQRSDRLAVVSTPLPRSLAPGDSAVLRLRLQSPPVRLPVAGIVDAPPGLPTDLWITLRVFIASSYDVNPSNDALYFVLRLTPDHRVAESRTLPAPPLSVRVIPR